MRSSTALSQVSGLWSLSSTCACDQAATSSIHGNDLATRLVHRIPAAPNGWTRSATKCAADIDVSDGERYERTIRFAPDGHSCRIDAGTVPVDVPELVTLRPEVQGCGTDFVLDTHDPARSAGQCLLDAHKQGTPAEAWSYELGDDPGRPLFFIRMTTDDGVVVFERPSPDGGSWTRARCDDLELAPDGHVIPTGCQAPEQLDLS